MRGRSTSAIGAVARNGHWCGEGTVNNAEHILHELDRRLDADVELTLYGRAALALGYPQPMAEYCPSPTAHQCREIMKGRGQGIDSP